MNIIKKELKFIYTYKNISEETLSTTQHRSRLVAKPKQQASLFQKQIIFYSSTNGHSRSFEFFKLLARILRLASSKREKVYNLKKLNWQGSQRCQWKLWKETHKLSCLGTRQATKQDSILQRICCQLFSCQLSP